MERAIEIEDVTRVFQTRSGDVTALQGVSLSVPEGQVVGLLGENGAGKTTLLKILATLLLPTSGVARVCGIDVVRDPKQVRKVMSVVFGGERGLYGRLSGRDNLRFFGTVAGLSRQVLSTRMDEALTAVGLASVADRAVETYSRGMRQRLHVAIGTLVRPKVLLLDEPTIGLDPVEAQRLRQSVAELARGGITIILTSHHLLDIEALADRICLLRQGLITHDAPLAEFVRLTGLVAVIVVHGRGQPPSALDAFRTVGEVKAIEHTADGWIMRVAVRSWSAELFTALGDLYAGLDIADIAVEPVTLEQVYADLMPAASR